MKQNKKTNKETFQWKSKDCGWLIGFVDCAAAAVMPPNCGIKGVVAIGRRPLKMLRISMAKQTKINDL